MSSLFFFMRPPKTRFDLALAPPEDVGTVGDGGGTVGASSDGDRDCTWPIAGNRGRDAAVRFGPVHLTLNLGPDLTWPHKGPH